MREAWHDITGRRFNSLVAVQKCPPSSGKNRGAKWVCRCDCGNERTTTYHSLRNGFITSCGCVSRARRRAANKARATHGMSGTKIYNVWMAMRARCSNPKAQYYPIYGGRGIKVCERWESSFENFLADMGPRPSPRHSIDRINNDGNYEPSNCRWATACEQVANKRRSAPATHCRQGHEYTSENTFVDARGRQCQQCRKAKWARRDAKRRRT